MLGRVLSSLLLIAGSARADEGMWTFDRFPSDLVRQRYAVEIDQAWLDHVREASVRLAQGCSASFVSSHGLVMTNHHCARACSYGLSSAGQDYERDGFYAATTAYERRCPNVEVNRLERITDATDEVHRATDGLAGEAFRDAEKAVQARLQAACSTGAEVRCDVVALYSGGAYAVHRYRRYQDVRLVWAPEDAAANFGGDPDNFEFPRYALDATFLRVYDHGEALATPQHLRFSTQPLHEGDFVVTSGNPGSTSRGETMAALAFDRDYALPRRLTDLAEERGMLNQFAALGPNQLRIAGDDLFGLSNSYKGVYGRQRTLADPGFMAAKGAEEAQLRRRIMDDPALATTQGAWDAIAQTYERVKPMRDRATALTQYPFTSRLMRSAIVLVRHAAEVAKPDEQRLRGYTDADAPALRQSLLSPAPIYPELEEVKLRYALLKMRERLTPNDPVFFRLFGRQSVEDLAHDLSRSALADPEQRRALLDGGAEAVTASTDPMVAFVRDRLDAPARTAQDQVEAEIGTALTRNATLIARARFALDGDRMPPDATFSPRLSFGAVRGYESRGRHVAPFTDFAGAFARDTGAEPFVLPRSWVAARDALDETGHLDVATTNDIIGGNSGSPLINAAGEAVGLIFDGNEESLGGDYGYDGRDNRAISVTVEAIWQVLRGVYHADRLVAELSE